MRSRPPAVISNARLWRLQPCPFAWLRQWFADVTPNPARVPMRLSIGESRRPAPALAAEALATGMSGPANYPTTIGPPVLRETLAVSRTFAHRLKAM